MLLLQLVHRRVNLGQEIVCIFEDHILCSKHILLQFAYVITAENLLLKYFQVPKSHIKYDLVALLATQEEQIKDLQGRLFWQALCEYGHKPRDGIVNQVEWRLQLVKLPEHLGQKAILCGNLVQN